MKAQVLHKYDPEMKEKVWVTGEELPNPKIEKASDVLLKLELQVFVELIYISLRVFGNTLQTKIMIYYQWLWDMKMLVG